MSAVSTPENQDIWLPFVRQIAGCVTRLGGDGPSFLRTATGGQDEDDAYVDGTLVASALEDVARARRDSTLSLSIASAAPLGSLGLVDYCAMTGPTVRDALARTARLYGLITRRVELRVEERDGVARITQNVRMGPRAPFLIELAFALIVGRLREMAGPPPIRSLRFAHEVSEPARYASYFGAHVDFAQSIDELAIDASFLDVAVRTAEPTAAAILEEHARRLQPRPAAIDPFLARVRAAVTRRLRAGDARVSSLARELRMSTRTLQRRLASCGTSHRRLLDQVRHESAVQRLGNDRASVVETAFELGFTQASAFHRAFARWTGTTPRAFREKER